MPRNVLQVVAVLLGLCAVGGFALGLGGGPNRSASARGEGPAGQPVAATEATPLNTDAPLPPEPEEEKVDEAAEKKKAEEEAAKLAAAKAATERLAPKIAEPPPLAVPPPEPDAPPEAAPAIEEPPH